MAQADLNALDDDALFESFMGSESGLFDSAPPFRVGSKSVTSLPVKAGPFSSLLPYKSTAALDRSSGQPLAGAQGGPDAETTASELFSTLRFDGNLEKRDGPGSTMGTKGILSNLASSYGEAPASSTSMACPDHRERTLDVFCMVCNTPICTSCAIFGKHQGHRCVPVDQAYKTCSAELRSHLNQLEHRCTSIRAFLAELGSLRMQLNSSAESCTEQIRNNIQFLKVSLDQRMNALLKEVAEVRDGRSSQLDAQVQALSEDVASYEKLLTLANTMLDTSSGAQFLKKHKFLCEQVLAAGQSNTTLQPVVDADIPLKMNVAAQAKSISELVLTGSTAFGNRTGAGYTSDLDKNGILFYLGTVGCGSDEFSSPVTTGLVDVTASEWGYCDHIDRVCWQENPSSVFTGGKFGSWICFRLNQGYKVKPNRYRIQHAGDCGSHTLRNWVFEGSVDNANWDVLSIHNSDTSMADAEGSHASWEIAAASVKRAYNHFRLTITGPNSAGGHHLMIGSIELWGMLDKDGVTKK
jgi:hypothetical protein